MLLLAASAGLLTTSTVSAAALTYTDWTAFTPGTPGTATGTMGSVVVTYSGDVLGGSWPDEANSTQVDGLGVNYWARSSPPPYYNPAYNAYSGVPNMPTDSDIIALSSGRGINTITFSQPVKDPTMLILSIGAPGYVRRWDFDQPFTILSSGRGYWDGDPSGSLWQDSGDVLVANEGHGALQFKGTFTSISWTADPEWWSGFTVGTAVPEPEEYAAAFGVALLGTGFWLRRKKVQDVGVK